MCVCFCFLFFLLDPGVPLLAARHVAPGGLAEGVREGSGDVRRTGGAAAAVAVAIDVAWLVLACCVNVSSCLRGGGGEGGRDLRWYVHDGGWIIENISGLTAVPFERQTTQDLSCSSPKGDKGLATVAHGSTLFSTALCSNNMFYSTVIPSRMSPQNRVQF